MIYQVGPYPPPLGGVSVHLSRLKDHMDQRQIPNSMLNIFRTLDIRRNIIPTRMVWLEVLLKFIRPGSIVHYHVSGGPRRFKVASISRKQRGKTHILTVHGDVLRFLEDFPGQAEDCLNSFDVVICVKQGDAEALHAMGLGKRVCYISPFIPPAQPDLEIQSGRVKQFLERFPHILCANASRTVDYDGQDLYGLDLCIEMMKSLVSQRQDVGLVYYISHVNDAEYIPRNQKRISESGLSKHILIEQTSEQFYPLIRRSSLFVRPTNTDGEPLSVREALHFGVPALASDVVLRPQGCALFENRNSKDFCWKAIEILNNLESQQLRIKNLPSYSGLEDLLALYDSLA